MADLAIARPSFPATPRSSTDKVARIRVMVCDDSAVIRSVLCRVLVADPAIEIVARACDGREALDIIRRQPNLADVLVLDIEMPRMDGLTALPLLLRAAPNLRIIIASTLTLRGRATTLEALRLGAADYIPKPSASVLSGDTSFERELVTKVRGLVRPPKVVYGSAVQTVVLRCGPLVKPRLLALGSSTGGPQALSAFFQVFKAQLGSGGLEIPAVLTQHMPAAFTPLLAEQLTRLTGLACVEAQDGAPLRPGHVHIAPGGRHLLIIRGPNGLRAQLDDGPAENFCRPSVDPMLRSAAQACDGKVLMVMLTGMGHDGLAGTRALLEAGGAVLAQDEASSVVWGMPGAVARAGFCHAVLPIKALAERTAHVIRGGA